MTDFENKLAKAALQNADANVSPALTTLTKAATDALSSLPVQAQLAQGMQPAIDALQKNSAVAELSHKLGVARIEELTAVAKPFADAFGRLQNHSNAVGELARAAMGAVGQNAAFSELSRRIEKQFKAIDAFKMPRGFDALHRSRIPDLEVPHPLPQLRIPPNPIHETNRQLASIEERFDRIEAIAVESAGIATALQASAADFLAKFESAASNNNRAAKRGILIGVGAIIIALLMPVAQIVYTEYWRVPADSEAAQNAIASLRKEISNLQAAQESGSARLSNTLAQSNRDISAAIRELREVLSKQKSQSTPNAKAGRTD